MGHARVQRANTDCASAYTPGTLVSADGTTIGFRRLGSGPGLILIHGGMMAAQNFMRLAAALSDSFEVIVADRRGRGSSGPPGADHGLVKECQDVAALVAFHSARYVFGLSSGALIALEAARTVPGIRSVAAYEPPFSIAGRDNTYWLPRFDREIAAGDCAAAMLTVLKATGDWPWLRLCPHVLLTPLLRLAMRAQERNLAQGDIAVRALVPTMHYDALLVREATAAIERLRSLQLPVLLLRGSKSATLLRRGMDVLGQQLPHATQIELAGVGHTAADNDGKPQLVAHALREFFDSAATVA